MTADEEEEKRGFKVEDRRRFSQEGEARDNRDEPTGEGSGAERSGTGSEPTGSPAAAAEEPDLEINFPTFVISLSTQALAHLGEIPSPVDGSVATDLRAARQLIDILGMLRDKTKGNLEKAEEILIDNILFELRMKYVEAQRRGSR